MSILLEGHAKGICSFAGEGSTIATGYDSVYNLEGGRTGEGFQR